MQVQWEVGRNPIQQRGQRGWARRQWWRHRSGGIRGIGLQRTTPARRIYKPTAPPGSGRPGWVPAAPVRARGAARAPRGGFSGLFSAKFRGLGGQKRLRYARERIQETLGARRPPPPADRAGVHGSRRRPRGQRARRGCVWDRHGSAGVQKRFFRGPGEQNFRDRIWISAMPRHKA